MNRVLWRKMLAGVFLFGGGEGFDGMMMVSGLIGIMDRRGGEGWFFFSVMRSDSFYAME